MPAEIQSQTSLVGRERELSALNAALGDAIAGRGRLVLISGEPGIGKTRLAEELSVRAASQGVRVLWGRCWEGDGAPAYWPLMQIIRSATMIARRASQSGLLGQLAILVPEIQPAPGSQPITPAIPEIPDQAGRFRMFDAVATFLKETANAEPLLLLVDDLHDADAASIQMLRFIARSLKDSRIMLVGTYRDAELRRSRELGRRVGDLIREGSVFPLGGLSRAEVAEFIRIRTSRAPQDALVEKLHGATGGNPLFVEGVIRLMIAEEEFEGYSPRSYDFRVPDGVRESIRMRVELLAPESQSFLATASVIGNEPDTALLQRLVGRDEEQVAKLMEKASEIGLVNIDATYDRRLRFTHPLVRTSIYEDIGAGDRLQLHRATAHAIEELYEADLTAHFASLAHHCGRAGLTDKAIDYSISAGDACDKVFATEQAIEHWRNALSLIEAHGGDPIRRARLLERIGEVIAAVDPDPVKSVEYLRRALQIYQNLGLDEQAASVHALLAQAFSSWSVIEDLAQARFHVEKALEVLHDRESSPAAFWTHVARAKCDLENHESTAALERAVAIATKIGSESKVAFTNALLGGRYIQGGRIREGLTRFNSAWNAANQLSDARSAGLATAAAAEHFLELGDPNEALAWCQRELAKPRMAENIGYAQTLRNFASKAYSAMGRIEDAISLANSGPVHGVASSVDVLVARGEWEDAERAVTESLQRAHQINFTGDCLLRLANLHWVLGERAESESLFRRVLKQVDRRMVHLELRAQAEIAALLVELGKPAEAQLHLTRATEIVENGEDWKGLTGWVLRAKALIELAEGNSDDADFFKAIGVFNRFGLVWEHAATLYSWGLALGQIGMHESAFEKFDLAIETYTKQRAGLRWSDRVNATRAALPQAARAFRPGSGNRHTVACTFHREGDFWTISHREHTFRLKDMKGLRYISHLLAHPGEHVHVHDLITLTDGDNSPQHIERRSDLQITNSLGDAGAILDARAKADYRKRRSELRAELEEAEQHNDLGKTVRIREELEMLEDQLSAAIGLGGRDRKAADHSERSRSRVARAIRGSLNSILENDVSLGHHLSTCIRTGYLCAYHPDPEGRFTWRL